MREEVGWEREWGVELVKRVCERYSGLREIVRGRVGWESECWKERGKSPLFATLTFSALPLTHFLSKDNNKPKYFINIAINMKNLSLKHTSITRESKVFLSNHELFSMLHFQSFNISKTIYEHKRTMKMTLFISCTNFFSTACFYFFFIFF